MEHGEGDGEKRHLEVGFVPSEVKKQWKNPSQVQILENAYAVSPNPSAGMKEELAKVTGLDYKQVQYWFGNRRYMDRHGPRRYKSRNEVDGRYVDLAAVSSTGLSYSSTSIADPVAGTESSTSRNPEMVQPLVPTGPVVMQAEIATQMPQELQRVVVHIEKKLGYPLRADGPILGAEFKPLPPGAFGAPLAQQRAPLWPCDGKVTERPTVKLIKTATSLPMVECLVTNLSNEGTLVAQDVDALNPDGSPRAVQEYQFFPMQPSWLDSYERVRHARCPLSSVNTSNYELLSTSSGGQNFSEYARVASAFPSQCQISNATNLSQQDKQMITSSAINGNQKAPDLLYASSAFDSQSGNCLATRVDNQFLSSDKMITCNANVCRREKIHPSGSTSGHGNLQHDYTEVQKMVDAKKERDLGAPDVGHNGPCQGCHGQDGQDTSHLQRGLRENQSSTVVAFKELDNKNCSEAIMNQTRTGRLHLVGNRHGYNRYFVRPRERSQSSIIVEGDTRMSYFSNIGNCAGPLIAEWNERENRAVYIENDNENALSWSTGSDSTYSDGFADQATENGDHYAQNQSVDQFGIDKGSDTCKDHNGQEVVDVDQNIQDDEDETDDEDYNDMEAEAGDKNMEVNEDRRASPFSSEQTA